MATLQSLQSTGACRSTPGRPGPYLQSSCSHRVTPFTSRTRKWQKRTHLQQCMPWTTCSARKTSSRVYAASVEEPQPEEANAEEAEIVIEDDDETETLLEDDEFKPHSVYEMSEEQLSDRNALLSTLAKSMETSSQPLSAREEEAEQDSRDVASTVVEAALELEQQFGSLRAVSAGNKENPLPFSDDKFWQDVEDDVETLEIVEDFDDTKVAQTDPFLQYFVSTMAPKPLGDDEGFHSDPDINALRNATVSADIVEYTAEEREALALLEGEDLEEEEDDVPVVLDALTSLLGVQQTLTEEEQQAGQEAASDPPADVNELLKDKDFATVVDMAALTAGHWLTPEEQTHHVNWLANKFTKTAAETTYSEVVASALDSARAAADAGELQQPDVEAFTAMIDEVAASVAGTAADVVDLPESFHAAYSASLASIAKDGFVEPAVLGDESAVDAFLTEHKDQMQELEAMDLAFSQLSLPDAKTAKEESLDALLQLVSELNDPQLNAAALSSEVSLSDAASAKDVFLKEAQGLLSKQDFAKVESYLKSAFVTKVLQSGTVPEVESELPLLSFPEVQGLDIGDDEADKVQPDFSKVAAEVDDADDSMLDDFDESVVKWRNVKAELLRNVLEDEEEDGPLSTGAPQMEEGASAASMKMLMQLVEDAAEGRPLLKDFTLEDSEVDDEVEFPSLEATLAEIRKGGDAAQPITDSPVLQQLVPLLEEAAVEKTLETPIYEAALPEDPEDEDEGLELHGLYDPLDDFASPVVTEAATAAELEERARLHAARVEELGLADDFNLADDEFEADEKEQALLAQVTNVSPEDLVKEWAEGDGFLELGAPQPDLEAALARAEAAAKAFEQSTSGLDDPTGLSDEDCQNLKVVFDSLYMIKAATSPQALQLKEAAEKLRAEMLAHRFAETIGAFVESSVTRGHLDDLNLLQFNESAFADLEDDKADQAMSDLVDKLTDVAQNKLVAAAEEAVKDLDDLELPEVDEPVPDDVSEQFEAAMVEEYGAERLGEMKAEAEIENMLQHPRMLGLELDPVEMAKGDEFDPEDELADLKMLEEAGVVAPVAEEAEVIEGEEGLKLLSVADAAAQAETEDEDALEGEELSVNPEASIEPPSAEGAILGGLVDQLIDSLQKVEEDDLYFDDEVYDADADTEASAEQAEVEEDEYEEDGYDDDEVDDMAKALDLQGEEDADEDEDEELAGLVYTDSAARAGGVEEEVEDDLDEYGEEEGEGDVAPEDMRNEYNSFMSEELFGNPTFADIWEEMGIPEMRPKDPVKMDQDDYDPNASAAQEEQEDEAEETTSRIRAIDDEGEDDLKDVPIGNWFGDEEEGDAVAFDEAEGVDEETSLEKLSKYYGGATQDWEGLDKSDAPRAELDVFSGATYLDGGDDDDRAADDVTGLMERVTMTKEGVVFIERVIQVQRVTKVVKGGNIMSFRCTAVVGNRSGIVGVGIGSAREVAKAVQKAVADAKKNVIMVPLTKYASIPHRVEKKFKASQCVINPAADGTGCIAGGAIRSVLELAGVKNCLAKQLGSRNPMNNAKLTIEALKDLQTWGEVAAKRNVPIEYLFAQNQVEADRALADHRGDLEEELY